MRQAPVFFALMLIVSTFVFPAEANGQCMELTDAAFEGDSDLTAALIASGVSVDCYFTDSYVDEDTGKTVTYSSKPLHSAVGRGDLKAVRLLLNHGANVNLKDGDGFTPNDIIFFWYEDMMESVAMGSPEEDWAEIKEICHLLEVAGGGSCID